MGLNNSLLKINGTRHSGEGALFRYSYTLSTPDSFCPKTPGKIDREPLGSTHRNLNTVLTATQN